MIIEIPDDADVVEVNTYRDGQLWTKSIYSHDGEVQSHALMVAITAEDFLANLPKETVQ